MTKRTKLPSLPRETRWILTIDGGISVGNDDATVSRGSADGKGGAKGKIFERGSFEGNFKIIPDRGCDKNARFTSDWLVSNKF